MENTIAMLIKKAKSLPESEASKVIIFINGLEAGINIAKQSILIDSVQPDENGQLQQTG